MPSEEIQSKPIDVHTAFDDLWKTIKELPRVGVAVLDRDGCYWYANRAFRELFYKSKTAKLNGRTIAELEGEAVAAERRAIFQRVCARAETVILMHTRLGRRIESVISPWRFDRSDQGESQHVIAISVHVSDSRPNASAHVIESDYNSWGDLDVLTKRQLQVLAALREGLKQREAAELLGVSPKTVETHRDELVKRLGVSSTLEAIRLADEAGLSVSNYAKSRHQPIPWRDRDDLLRDTA